MQQEPVETRSILKAAVLYEMLRGDWTAMSATIPWDTVKDEDWTRWLLGYFYDKGKSLGFSVETKPPPTGKGEGEYLVDLCWWKREDSQYWLELALESEWLAGDDEIEHDFHKLVDSKSRLKVWVCSYGERQMSGKRNQILKAVAGARYKFPDEEYLIANMPYSEKPENKDCLTVDGFWMNYLGTPAELRPFRIYRNS